MRTPAPKKAMRPGHPGEILREDYLVPLGMSAGALAKAINLPRTRIERVVKEEPAITADTALRLARYFRTTPEFWLAMQAGHDLFAAQATLADEIARIPERAA